MKTKNVSTVSRARRFSTLLAVALLIPLLLNACSSDPDTAATDNAEQSDTSAYGISTSPDSLRAGTETEIAPDSEDIPSAPLYPAEYDVEAPDFSLPTLEGDTYSLSNSRGNVVVVNFWATWCPPCREEIPDFIRLQEEYKDQGLTIVGVSLDEEGFDVVRPFAEQYDFNYPVVVDDGTAAAAYGPIAVMPTTFLVDRKGLVRYYAPGMLTSEGLRPVLTQMLNEES
jgi:peroxiredoxin